MNSGGELEIDFFEKIQITGGE